MKRDIFILSGGLGNQLFQFSRLHGVENNVQIYFPVPLDSARNFDASKLCADCLHISNIRVRRSLFIDARCKLHSYLNNRNSKLFRKLSSILLDVEENPYTFSSTLKRSSLHSGYYQHWKYVHKVLPLIQSELDIHLARLISKVEGKLPSPRYGVVHFRRGDLINYADSMGLLTKRYFHSAIAKALDNIDADIRLVVITDDYAAARASFPSASIHIYGPEDFNTWESLAIMSKAQFVITSNSTFSWWGALMCHINGGKAYIPDPWFKNWAHDPADAFCYPGFNRISSDFQNTFS